MNQIKLKIQEIGLSQREISVRLGKNPSYLAGVFRSGLSTAKQAELMDGLDAVANGGTILSDEKLLELVDDQLEKSYAQNEQLKAQLLLAQEGNVALSKKLNEAQNAGIKALESYGIVQNQLNCANSLADVRGKFLDQCNKERWKYQDKYAYHFKLNLLLIYMIVIGLILWVVV